MKHNKLNSSQIKESINPYDFYLREMDLHKFGAKSGKWTVAGLCPFHTDRFAGSFKINLETGSFICFSCGAKGSDIIAFTMEKHELSFSEALTLLGREWGGY
jgi:putative DNA primase/helicase